MRRSMRTVSKMRSSDARKAAKCQKIFNDDVLVPFPQNLKVQIPALWVNG